MTLMLWLLNLGTAAVVVAPLYAWIYRHTSTSTAADRLSEGFTAVWWTDFSSSYATALGGWTETVWIAGVAFLLLHVFLDGGVLCVLHDPSRRDRMARFGRGCGAYFGRFLRLLLLALACYWLVFQVDRGLSSIVASWTEGGALQARAWWAGLGRELVTVSLFFTVSLVFDYARVRTVLNDARPMLREAAASLRFVLVNLRRTAGLYAALVILGGFAAALYWIVSQGAERLGAGWGIALVFVVQQLYIGTRIWLRLATWGSAMDLHLAIEAQGAGAE